MRQIPSLGGLPREIARIAEAIKQNIEELRGISSSKIQPLPETASNEDVINKINEIITRLQG